MKVAEIGKVLFYDAICTADEQDNAGFFAEAYSHWGPWSTTCWRNVTATSRAIPRLAACGRWNN